MKLPRRNFLHLAAGAAALPVLSRIARAQAYPTRPVRLIAGFPPAARPHALPQVGKNQRHLSGSALLGFRELWSSLWLEVGRLRRKGLLVGCFRKDGLFTGVPAALAVGAVFGPRMRR
jgi:hypothetical protein